MRSWPQLTAMLLLHAMTLSVVAQTEPPQTPPEELVLESFETFGEDGTWAGFAPSGEHVTDGDFSARWGEIERAPQVSQSMRISDWSAYDALIFSCHSEAATGSLIYLLIYSENDATAGLDYFCLPIEVNWEGAYEYVIPFRAFQSNRSPAGWDSIDSVCFTANWNEECVAVPGTVLYIDHLALRKVGRGDRLTVSDLELDVPAWRGLETDAMAAVGRLCGLWRLSEATPFIRTTAIPHDWRGYDTLRFWVYSPGTDSVRLKLLLYSDSTKTELVDSYCTGLVVDWEGWKQVVIPLHQFMASRQPKGWAEIDNVTIAAGGWGLTVPEGAELRIDEMALTREIGDVLTISDFESDAAGWLGLARSTEHAHGGQASGKWASLDAQGFVRTMSIPPDWTEWDTLEFWLYSARANRQPLMLILYSNSDITEKVDSYNYKLTVDWTGWRRIALRKPEFIVVRRPVGWHLIQNVTIAGAGWGLTAKADTTLFIDDVSLRRSGGALELEFE